MDNDKPVEKIPPPLPPTPRSWRVGIAAGILVAVGLAYLLQAWLGPRGVAAFGVICFIGLTALFSANLRAVNWRTIVWGFALQLLLGLFVIRFQMFGVKP